MAGALISAWSFSTWSTFQKCKHRVYLDKVAKAPQPPIINTEDKEHPLLRGNRIHEAAELYVTSSVELISELKKFEKELNHLKHLFNLNKVEVEQPWAFTSEWKITNWSSIDAWVRAKLDAFIRHSDSACVVVDYKSGKSWGNEVTHNLQGQIYAIMALLRYPEIEEVTVEFWYVDQNEITTKHYTRNQVMKFLNTWTQRGNAIVSEVEFKPNPSNAACKYCPFGSNVGSGVCEYKI